MQNLRKGANELCELCRVFSIHLLQQLSLSVCCAASVDLFAFSVLFFFILKFQRQLLKTDFLSGC